MESNEFDCYGRQLRLMQRGGAWRDSLPWSDLINPNVPGDFDRYSSSSVCSCYLTALGSGPPARRSISASVADELSPSDARERAALAAARSMDDWSDRCESRP